MHPPHRSAGNLATSSGMAVHGRKELVRSVIFVAFEANPKFARPNVLARSFELLNRGWTGLLGLQHASIEIVELQESDILSFS